jgi:hypothetical protein
MHRTCLTFTAVLMSIAAGWLYARSPIAPPTPNMLAGAYVGFTEGDVDFVRIELDASGAGYISIAPLVDKPAQLYRIGKWTIKDLDIRVSSVRPLDESAYPIDFRKITYTGNRSLQVTFGGKNWQRTAHLIDERYFSSRASETNNRIDRYRKSGKAE